jgi:hypothetical protein
VHANQLCPRARDGLDLSGAMRVDAGASSMGRGGDWLVVEQRGREKCRGVDGCRIREVCLQSKYSLGA